MSSSKRELDSYSKSSKYRIIKQLEDADAASTTGAIDSSDTESSSDNQRYDDDTSSDDGDTESSSSNDSRDISDDEQLQDQGRSANCAEHEVQINRDESSGAHCNSGRKSDESGNESDESSDAHCKSGRKSDESGNESDNNLSKDLESPDFGGEHVLQGDTSSDSDSTSSHTDSSSSDSESSSSDTDTEASESDENSEDTDDDSPFDGADEPLYPGAPLTTLESIIAIFTLATRFKITGVLLSAILSLISLHCIRPHNCVKTLYKFKKFFAKIKTPLIRHHYCPVCFSKLDIRHVSECHGHGLNCFLEIPILEQLKSMYKRPGFFESLDQTIGQNQRCYGDIQDGSIYKSLPKDFLEHPNRITFTWNSHGVPLFKSSKISIWPLYLMINELPYKLRIKKENMILAGLWIGPVKPYPELFLSVFQDDLKKLYQGLEFHLPNLPSPVQVRGMIIAGTCDLPAKAIFANIKQYNSKNGCPNCKITTIKIDGTQTYPFVEKPDLRTTEETKLHAEQALEKGEPVVGVKGPSFLSLIMLNYLLSLAIDSMHCALQGATKKVMMIWFHVDFRTHPASLFSYIGLINERIKRLKLPSFIQRVPRDVSEFAYWKASELKVFLLIYSPIILEGIMPKEYYDHHLLLVHALTLLSLTIVTDENIEEARKLLMEYVSRFEFLYGKKYMTCVIHLLLHLADDVKKFGPLWVMSCSPFENLNGILKSYVHGSKNPELQICSAVVSYLMFEELKGKVLKPDSEVFKFCESMEKSGTHRKKTKFISEGIFALGLYKKCTSLPQHIIDVLRNSQIDLLGKKFHLFQRILLRNKYLETESYARKKKTNSSCIEFRQNESVVIGIIEQFLILCDCACIGKCEECIDSCKTYVIVSECALEYAFPCSITNSHIPTMHTIRRMGTSIVINVENILNVCSLIDNDDKSYAIRQVNTQESE